MNTDLFMNKSVYLGLSILEISEIVCVSFGMIMCNQNMAEKKLNYVRGILTFS